MSHVLFSLALLTACPPSGGRVPEDPAPGDTSGTLDTAETAASVDTAETDTASETGDTGEAPPPVRYFEPDYIYAYLLAGQKDGELVDMGDLSGNMSPPYLGVFLVTRTWYETQDPRQMCGLYWQAEGTVYAPFDWDLVFTPWAMEENCRRLDPARFGEDPLMEAGVSDGYVRIADFTAWTLAILADAADWNPLDEPYDLFGAEMSVGGLDTTLNAFATYYPGMQPWYGAAYAANEEVLSDFSTLMDLDQIWAGDPAVYYVVSYTYGITGW